MVDPISCCNLALQCWACFGGPNYSTYVFKLEENHRSLSGSLERLKNLRDDVKTRVEEADVRGMTWTNEVDGWLQRVEQRQGEAQNILDECSRRIHKDCHCLGDYCPRNCFASYKLGKKVAQLLNEVDALIDQGNSFTEVAHRRIPLAGEEIPLPSIKGSDLMFDKVCSCIRENQAGIIGLYGIGGVGKTTLLKKINNEFLQKTANGDFEVVIWVGLSKGLKEVEMKQAIRKGIGDTLGITQKEDKNQVAEAPQIFRLLTRKTFLLLLDDIWAPFDMSEIGIPHPANSSNKSSKVIFTTRSEQVCGAMEAKRKFKVECLPPDEAWSLFQEKVGEDTLKCHPDIPRLAKDVANECGGLPLALITVGRAMASKTTPQEWEHAITMLQKHPTEVSDHSIWVAPVISYWIGEGFIKGFDEMREAFNEGYDIIETLKRACLLEPDGTYLLKMHDLIRDMALWIISNDGRNKDVHLLVRYDDLTKAASYELEEWHETKRIFVMISTSSTPDQVEHQIINTVVSPECPNLTTFITDINLDFNQRMKFPTNFFQSATNSLRVLDLSYCSIGKEFTRMMVELEYLSLAYTDITELPYQVGNLTKLKYLNLSGTFNLGVVSIEGILRLLDLRLLDLFNSKFGDWELEGRSRLMELFETLKHFTDLSVTIKSDISLQSWINSDKLRNYTTRLCVQDCENKSIRITTNIENMKHLTELRIKNCPRLREVSISWRTENGSTLNLEMLSLAGLPKLQIVEFPPHVFLENLQDAEICNCQVLEDLTWLRHTQKLKRLWLGDLPRLKLVVASDEEDAEERSKPLSSLKFILLLQLPELEIIYPGALPLPCLEEIVVKECPKLKKLPFDSNTANNTMQWIKASEEWWNALEWDDESTKSTFEKYFTTSLYS
ncbi:PREDICTED: putative disease resistance protein At4g10780 isoform X2 [Nelumbo nucifera]|uniref:Disease resistance protein At4g10780 isoform X2 n=1 Tax=Nelumbo nucifera TaxID=4432 RepID=A0A1U8ALP0_NELNU|nr:PREDICTED: putative disease resistance protein At4g10780 isoform X2 [Nelumbo nucifera]